MSSSPRSSPCRCSSPRCTAARIDLPAVGRRLVRPALGVLAVVAVGALAQITLPNPFTHLMVFAPVMLVTYALVAVPAADLRQWARPLLRRGTT